MATTIAITVIDAKFFYGVAGAAAGTEATTCSDTTLKVTKNEVKANNRRSKYGGVVPTITDIELDVTFPVDSSDAHQAALRAACITDTPISSRLLSKSGITAPTIDAFVTNMEDGQPLEGLPTVKFTLKRAAMGNTDRVVAWA